MASPIVDHSATRGVWERWRRCRAGLGRQRLIVLGQLAGDRKCADDRAARVADRCDGELDRKRGSVLSETDGLKVLDGSTFADLRQDGLALAGAICGAEQVH